ncbi:golgin candidate 2 [Dorcoceras hygrometricum]|uniref:Golgin candidate 2 n=1 Tax=Dorcoceras hygrometricum TaxID=472368 RepID=A0A2Z7C6S0_9LAMI|nr:golgin candidate 2 [Dorcoceras hygrometricum]
MAHWISSKLKAAESLLQQIDQQAAESLGKNENSRPGSELGVEGAPGNTPETKRFLKDQLRKKAPENVTNQSNNSDKLNLNVISGSNSDVNRNQEAGISQNLNSTQNLSGGLTENDWTELLSVPEKREGSGGINLSRSSRGALGIQGLKKDGKKLRNFGPASRKSNVGLENIPNADINDRAGNARDVKPLFLNNQSPNNGGGGESDQKHTGTAIVADDNSARTIEELNAVVDGQKLRSATDLTDKNSLDKVPVSRGRKLKLKLQSNYGETSKSGMNGRNGPTVMVPSLPSDVESNSDADTTSTSDSEIEREREERRKRRQQILAERAAAKAVEAIQERENLVARLEGEKQSLEKMLEERAKQQVQEASELQTSMMVIMDAVELEKQKHNNTRMEAHSRLAKLESANADLSRSLANVQKSLEAEVDRVAELRQEVVLKEAAHEELQRKISNMQQNGERLQASKGVGFALEMLEAEYSFTTDKLGRMQEKAKTLESSIESTRKEMEYPTEVEIELKRKLGLLTDHLIQKQAQVETLTSEKASLIFRIEAASRLLDENKLLANSVDTPNKLEFSSSKLKPLLKERMQSGHRHFGSMVRQLDSLFCLGAIFLRRNRTARVWSIFYIVCLHLWVIYILTSHSRVSDDLRSGATVSLENINNTESA